MIFRPPVSQEGMPAIHQAGQPAHRITRNPALLLRHRCCIMKVYRFRSWYVELTRCSELEISIAGPACSKASWVPKHVNDASLGSARAPRITVKSGERLQAIRCVTEGMVSPQTRRRRYAYRRRLRVLHLVPGLNGCKRLLEGWGDIML